MSIADAKRRWTVNVVNEDFGVVLNPPNMRPRRGGPIENSIVIGQQAVRVHLGTYYALGFIRADVTAFFAFDENEELIDIFIIRDYDLL